MAYKARRLILSPLHLQTEASSTTFVHLHADHGTNLASSWSTVKVLIRLLWCHLLYRTFNSYLPRSPEILSSSCLAQNHDFQFQHQRSPLKKIKWNTLDLHLILHDSKLIHAKPPLQTPLNQVCNIIECFNSRSWIPSILSSYFFIYAEHSTWRCRRSQKKTKDALGLDSRSDAFSLS